MRDTATDSLRSLDARAAVWRARDVVVLLGGTSAERAVSLRTGAAMHAALVSLGIPARCVDPGEAGWPALLDPRPDAVVMALHGSPGEDGLVQGWLDLFDVPYTGSGVAASAIAIDKVRTKRLAEAAGIPTAAWRVVEAGAPFPSDLGLPAIVKPSLDGSSVGVARIDRAEDWVRALGIAGAGAGELLVEEAIDGVELTVGVRDGESLGTVEIQAASGFYDYEAKYVRGDTSYHIPPRTLDAAAIAHVESLARAVAAVVGCRGVCRVDFLYDAVRGPFLLEVNTIPGMTPTSLVPKLAQARGQSFEEFVLGLLEASTTDQRLLRAVQAQRASCS